MALPIWMLKGMQMPASRKAGLAAIFSIAITDVVFDIVRTSFTVNGETEVSPWTVWDILEATVAVVVSALPSYRALFGNSKKKPWAPLRESSREILGNCDRNRHVDSIIGLELIESNELPPGNPSIGDLSTDVPKSSFSEGA